MMTESELLKKLDELRALPHETEWVVFKEAKSNYDFRKLGKYFSAIANEATKSDIESLLLDKLSDVLSLQQKKNKIRNMLHQMAIKDHTITTYQKGRYAKWKLF
jgi:ATP-dependent DNA helicase RecG